MSTIKRQIKLKAEKRGHKLSSFFKSFYHNSIYETATCHYCGSKVFLRDEQLQYETVTESDCIKQMRNI